MEMHLKTRFEQAWVHYFGSAELPLAYFYTDETPPAPKGSHCIIADLERARQGDTVVHCLESLQCNGSKRYLGFTHGVRPNFRYFLSTGIPGELEGERYKKTPELVDEQMKYQPPFFAPGHSIVFKRWDKLLPEDEPQVVIFFAPPDVLSGLFTLANYAWDEPNGVICPMGSGCASIVYYPMQELANSRPRSVLGMLDVSARPHVPAGVMTLAIPYEGFTAMVMDMEESFLGTRSWDLVRRRIG